MRAVKGAISANATKQFEIKGMIKLVDYLSLACTIQQEIQQRKTCVLGEQNT